MIIFKKSGEIKKYLQNLTSKGVSTAFVPTMGALHDGHLTLINESKKLSELSVCSIFINPTQFNNSEDFSKYPVTIEQDIYKLEINKCDVLFMPDVEEMYPNGIGEKFHADLGYFENILEGKYRPGHFQGVCNIVKHLVEIIEPDKMLLGQKDFQQCLVIRKLLQLMHSKTELHVCQTVRETDGLAMSSRNLRLTADERIKAVQIFKTLESVKTNAAQNNIEDIKRAASDELTAQGFKVDYVEVADTETLLPVKNLNDANSIVALAAAYLNNIRLIDNLIIKG